MRVEPNTIKRRGVGLRGYDPERASPGFTLFTTARDCKTVYLIDLQGNVVHTWQMPYPAGLYGYLTERGTLFYNGSIPNDTFIGRSVFHGGVALEMDWSGHVLWEIRHTDHHHEGRRLMNGNVLLLCSTDLPAELVPKVRGGLAGTEHEGGKMNGDYLVELTTDGRLVWEWRAWEHLDPLEDAIPCPQDTRSEWTHANAVTEMPDGNLVLSFRNTSQVVMVDRRTGEIYWKLGPPPLSGQHAPELLPNGNLLIFDNGPHRVDETMPFSRVLEIDPATKEIVWKYQDNPLQNFLSPRISSAQRLPNGNTLINEGNSGRLFEVTPAGEVVWEYVNPYFAGPSGAEVNHVFRAYRYTEEEIARAQAPTK
jgi:hypothetical protein